MDSQLFTFLFNFIILGAAGEFEVLYEEVARSEVLDWWNESRHLVSQRCIAAEQELIELANEKTADLSTVDLLNPWSSVCDEIQADITERAQIYTDGLANEMEMSLRASIDVVENAETFREVDWAGAGFMAASGATAVGAMGLAVGATGLATTSLPAFVFLSATAFSWPLFAAIGTGAVALGAVSVTARTRGYEWALERYRETLHETIRAAMTGDTNNEEQISCRTQLCRELDTVRDIRLKGLTL